MSEYDAQWRLAAVDFEDDDNLTPAFEMWRERMQQTTQNHFVESANSDLGGSFDTPPEHGPEVETIIGSELRGDVAFVQTRCEPSGRQIHEYTLRATGDDWRISAIDTHFGDPEQPFVERAAIDAFLADCGPDAPFAAMPKAQRQLDESVNFTDREVTGLDDDGGTVRVTLSEVGTLVTESGALSVLDFGYGNNDARPFRRTVAPGAYPVDRVLADGRNAAVRVRFTEEAPVAWHPASPVEGGHVFGVDSGSVCIVDYVAYSEMTTRDKAAAYAHFTAESRPAKVEFALAGTNVGIAVDSGYGDGGYPAFWGVDAQGRVVQLVVDFMVLVDEEGKALRHRLDVNEPGGRTARSGGVRRLWNQVSARRR